MQIVRIVLFAVVGLYSIYLLYDSIKNNNRGDLVMAIILITLLILTRFVSIVYISGPSMQPTFRTGDCILVFRTDKVERNDIAVVEWQDKWLIKRVVGLPSETLEMEDGKTYIDGELIVEDFEYFSGNRSLPQITIPDDYIFIVGDNRENSHDSRAFGPVPTSDIFGRLVLRLDFVSKIPFLQKFIEMMATIQTG
ncbi:MAG: signal peptidase I [Clostridia bacterium]